jgi:hypothetical protein
MKKITLLIVLVLGWQVVAYSQTIGVYEPCSIGIACSEYTNNLNKVWNIDIATDKNLKLDYSVNIENGFDKIKVYSIDNSGTAILQETLTGSKSGTILSSFKNGKMKIEFTTDGSVNCSTNSSLTGFQINISEIITNGLVDNPPLPQPTTVPSTIIIPCYQYVNNMDRIWYVNNPTGHGLILNYSVNLENNNDMVKIYTGHSVSDENLIKVLTGVTSGTIYTSKEILMKFTTNGSISGMNNANCNTLTTMDERYGGIRINISEDPGQEFGHVTLNGTITGNSTEGALRVETNHGYLDLGPQNSVYTHLSTDRGKFLFNKPVFLQDGNLSSYGTNNLYFQTNATNRMTILNTNGYVGIGTSSPTALLDVNGAVKMTSLSLTNGQLSSYSTNNLYLRTNTTNRITILNSNGYVGIGTTAPATLLDVNGAMKSSSLSLTNGQLNSYNTSNLYLQTNSTNRMTILNSNGYVGIGTSTPAAKLHVDGSTFIPFGHSYWIGSYNDSGNRVRLHHNGTVAYIDYSPVLYFRSGLTTMATFSSNGNVGIGTANPQNKLDVNGIIRATEIKVEAGWADFVFSKDYKLPTLNEVKQHIDKNKHLPGIPTEKEVKENGVNLGEMQSKLLQKIEELTLYLIQQDNTIRELKNEIQELKEK